MTSPVVSTSSTISGNIVSALYISDPELDTSIGTPLRKVIDAVADQIAQATVDSYLTDYQYDIDSLTGGALDDFCANFGIARLIGVRATGTLTLSRSAAIAATSAVTIQPNVQAVTGTIPQQTIQTTISSSMDVGVTSVDIPAQAVSAGPNSNILANTPLQLISSVTGVSTVSNSAAFVGGTIDETDAQLIARFKSTVFRNLAGTSQMYLGIALQALATLNNGSFGVSQANVLGSATTNIEQIQISSGNATASITTAAFFSTNSVQITDTSGNTYAKLSQYTVTVNNSVQPATLTIHTVGASVGMPDGVYLLQYDYVPIVSRNDPFNTRWGTGVVNNRVDVIVNGQISAPAVQSAAYVNTTKFSSTSSSPLYIAKFVDPLGNHPLNNDVFIPLGFGPILTIPTSLTWVGAPSGGALLGTHYQIVHQDDAFGYSPNSLFGIWWKTSTNGSTFNPPNNTIFSGMQYTFNSVPTTVANNILNWRMVGTDVQVHAGKQALLAFNFAIVYNRNVTVSSVNTNIVAALGAYLQTLGFNAAVQVSDIVQVVHNVAGVDNVRLTTSTDNPTTYAIQLVNPSGTVLTTYQSGGEPIDIYFDERTYPVLYGGSTGVVLNLKARNTFQA